MLKWPHLYSLEVSSNIPSMLRAGHIIPPGQRHRLVKVPVAKVTFGFFSTSLRETLIRSLFPPEVSPIARALRLDWGSMEITALVKEVLLGESTLEF
ncbi:hypothetical protein Tco_1164147 [Tanacetum coccineum]